MAPDLASRLRWAPTLPRVFWLQISPPDCGGLRRYHVSYVSGPRLLAEVGSGTAMCLTALDPASLRGGLRAAMRPAVPCGPRISSIKKSLASLPVQLGMHVSNTRTHVSKASDIRAIMGLQDVRVGNTVNACKAYGQTATV
jgi:hypothetical protein